MSDLVRHTIRIPNELSQWLTDRAERQGMSMNALITELCEASRDETFAPSDVASIADGVRAAVVSMLSEKRPTRRE